MFQVPFTLKKKDFLQSVYFWLLWFFIAAYPGLYLVVSREGYSLVAVFGLLIAVASLIEEHRL